MAERTILFVPSVPFVGGAELTQLNVLEECVRRGCAIRAVVPDTGELAGRLRAMGATILVGKELAAGARASRYRSGVRSWGGAAALAIPSRPLLREISRLRKGVVYCGGLRAQARASLAARVAGRPLAWHVHEHYGGAPAFAMGWLARLPHLVLTVSQSVAEQSALRPAKQVHPVLNGVPDQFFQSSHRPSDRGNVRVGAVAHLTPLKGHFAYFRLVDAVRRAGDDIDAVLLGGSPYLTSSHRGYADRVIREASALSVDCRAVAPEAVPNEMSGWDLLIHLTERPEGFGRVLAEAQAAAIPVVTYDWGGAPEIVADGTGFLVPPGDLREAIDAATRLVREPALRKDMGRKARAHAEVRLRAARAADEGASALLSLC